MIFGQGSKQIASLKDPPLPYSRAVGSQGEEPTLLITAEGLTVGGYQGYEIRNKMLTFGRVATAIKYEMMRPYVEPCLKSGTIVDIGCSAGGIGLKFLEEGARKVVFIDHDPSYTELVRLVLEKLEMEGRAEIHTTKVGRFDKSFDTGIALALVHWLYSYSEAFGSLDQIVSELKKIASKTLIVEWVSPLDAAIRTGAHIERNPEFHRAPYTLVNFINALAKHYRFYQTIGRVNSTRSIWIASQERIESSYSERLKANWRVTKIKQKKAMSKFREGIVKVLSKA